MVCPRHIGVERSFCRPGEVRHRLAWAAAFQQGAFAIPHSLPRCTHPQRGCKPGKIPNWAVLMVKIKQSLCHQHGADVFPRLLNERAGTPPGFALWGFPKDPAVQGRSMGRFPRMAAKERRGTAHSSPRGCSAGCGAENAGRSTAVQLRVWSTASQ